MSSFILIGQLLLGFERTYKKYEKIVLIISVLLITVCWFYMGICGRFIIHALGIFIVMFVYFNEKKRVLFMFYLGMVPMLSMLNSMFKMVVKESLAYMNVSLHENVKKTLALALLFTYISIIGLYFKKRHTRGLRNIGVGYLVLFLLLLVIDSIIVVALGTFITRDLQTTRKGLVIVLYIGIVLGILIQLVLLINTLLTRNVYRENETLAKQFLDKQKEHYLYLEKREEETKKFRHDIRNHLLVLGDCIKKKDYEGAEEYLDTLNEKVDSLGNKISVNNGIADAILNKFYDEAKEQGIEIKVNGRFPMECYISAFDICAVLSNLLSNAILAESQYGGDNITLDIRHTDDEIFIIIENDYCNELKRENESFKSSKPDSAGHGYGLKNIEESVGNNKGHVSYSTDNNRFKVMLSMRNERKEPK